MHVDLFLYSTFESSCKSPSCEKNSEETMQSENFGNIDPVDENDNCTDVDSLYNDTAFLCNGSQEEKRNTEQDDDDTSTTTTSPINTMQVATSSNQNWPPSDDYSTAMIWLLQMQSLSYAIPLQHSQVVMPALLQNVPAAQHSAPTVAMVINPVTEHKTAYCVQHSTSNPKPQSNEKPTNSTNKITKTTAKNFVLDPKYKYQKRKSKVLKTMVPKGPFKCFRNHGPYLTEKLMLNSLASPELVCCPHPECKWESISFNNLKVTDTREEYAYCETHGPFLVAKLRQQCKKCPHEGCNECFVQTCKFCHEQFTVDEFCTKHMCNPKN